jgi:hypothetical protein
MCSNRRMRCNPLASAIILVVALIVSVSAGSVAQAAILLPDQIDLSADDLERTLSSDATGSAGSPSRRCNSDSLPSDNSDKPSERLSLLQGQVPGGGASSNGSSSSVGGNTTVGTVGNPLATTIALRDDAPLGRLAEDQGLSLPDPPGSDLLRPPRG